MQTNDPAGFPEVRARLQRHRRFPGTPPLTTRLDIWASGQRFRVRDSNGRPAQDLLADVTSQDGLGRVPSTIEEFMDAAAEAARPRQYQTNVYGDLVTGVAIVDSPGEAPWTTSAADLVPVVEQLLLPRIPISWKLIGDGMYLERTTQVYESEIGRNDNESGFTGRCIWTVAAPFLLSRQLHIAGSVDSSVTVEVVELFEGTFEASETSAPAVFLSQ